METYPPDRVDLCNCLKDLEAMLADEIRQVEATQEEILILKATIVAITPVGTCLSPHLGLRTGMRRLPCSAASLEAGRTSTRVLGKPKKEGQERQGPPWLQASVSQRKEPDPLRLAKGQVRGVPEPQLRPLGRPGDPGPSAGTSYPRGRRHAQGVNVLVPGGRFRQGRPAGECPGSHGYLSGTGDTGPRGAKPRPPPGSWAASSLRRPWTVAPS